MNTIRQLSPEKAAVSPEQLLPLLDRQFTLKPFDPLTIEFFNSLSRFILTDKRLNRLAAFAALGFWLRQANINQIIRENRHLTESSSYSIEPLGIVFHVCPSNVDTMFIYSLAISLLMGNKNIIKLSSRLNNESVDYFIDGINSLLKDDKFGIFKHYLAFITYSHDDEISGYFSLNADARILWGGDQTIKFFNTFQTRPKSKDLVFADRVSAAVFKSRQFLELSDSDKKETSRKFFNDTFTFDQLGCSSPQVLFTIGTDVENRQFTGEIYHLLNQFAVGQYDQDVYALANMKMNFLAGNVIDGLVASVIKSSNYLVFAELGESVSEVHKSCGAGFLFVKHLESADNIGNFINRKVQTLSYFGLSAEELRVIGEISYSRGIDRLVPVGMALNFDYIWDGYNLADELCNKKRVIQIEKS